MIYFTKLVNQTSKNRWNHVYVYRHETCYVFSGNLPNDLTKFITFLEGIEEEFELFFSQQKNRVEHLITRHIELHVIEKDHVRAIYGGSQSIQFLRPYYDTLHWLPYFSSTCHAAAHARLNGRIAKAQRHEELIEKFYRELDQYQCTEEDLNRIHENAAQHQQSVYQKGKYV